MLNKINQDFKLIKSYNKDIYNATKHLYCISNKFCNFELTIF